MQAGCSMLRSDRWDRSPPADLAVSDFGISVWRGTASTTRVLGFDQSERDASSRLRQQPRLRKCRRRPTRFMARRSCHARRRLSLRRSSRTNAIACARFSLASPFVRPLPLAPGISGQCAMKHSSSGSKIAVNLFCIAGSRHSTGDAGRDVPGVDRGQAISMSALPRRPVSVERPNQCNASSGKRSSPDFKRVSGAEWARSGDNRRFSRCGRSRNDVRRGC